LFSYIALFLLKPFYSIANDCQAKKVTVLRLLQIKLLPVLTINYAI